MNDSELREFEAIWNGWCFDTGEEFFGRKGVWMPCTKKKGHKGDHQWTAERWTKYMKLHMKYLDAFGDKSIFKYGPEPKDRF